MLASPGIKKTTYRIHTIRHRGTDSPETTEDFLMQINFEKFVEEIGLFKARLSTTDGAKRAIAFAEMNVQKKIESEAQRTGYPVERVLLAAICGELTTPQKQKEFLSRLILLNILTE